MDEDQKPDTEAAAFNRLSPDEILNAVESRGIQCDGRLLALNSYENRVYQVGLEEQAPVIVKFYRPMRWSDDAILEEHAFTLALFEREIPVVPPIVDGEGATLHHYGPYRFSFYERRGGRSPELDNPQHLEQLGRFIGRIHAMSEVQSFSYRPTLNTEHFAVDSYRFLLEAGFIPTELQVAYRTLSEDLITRVEACFARSGKARLIRLHGDCHPGNILWTDAGPHIVDFDDARMGPAIQDLWMFLSGDRSYMTERLADMLEGYTAFRNFDSRELHLIEALRTLRMMHYAAWLARRWDDPAFPRAFPWFNSVRYWEEHILSLREQAALLDEHPLIWE